MYHPAFGINIQILVVSLIPVTLHQSRNFTHDSSSLSLSIMGKILCNVSFFAVKIEIIIKRRMGNQNQNPA